MQILYVTTMLAVFVLCIALFTTARRILSGSPLPSGELGLPTFEANPLRSEAPADILWGAISIEDEPMTSSELPPSTEALIEEIKAVEHLPMEFFDHVDHADLMSGLETGVEDDMAASPFALAEPEPAPAKARAGQIMTTRRSSTPAYTYFLEVLLISVSVVVLVRTQRSNSSWRTQNPSGRRIA